MQQVADQLIQAIQHAYLLQRIDWMAVASRFLLNAPLPASYRGIAQYYLAIYLGRKGEFERARALFEGLPSETPLEFRSRAMMGVGTHCWAKGDSSGAAAFYAEAARIAASEKEFNPRTLYFTQFGAVLLKSLQGDHHGALRVLDQFTPVARAVGRQHPVLWYDYLNSLAVELMAVGRIEEARNVADHVVASPYAPFYPAWRETRAEIAEKERGRSRSTITFTQPLKKAGRPAAPTPGKVLHLPERHRSAAGASKDRPAAVIDFQAWMIKMVKKPNGDPPAGSSGALDNQPRRAPASDVANSTGRQLMLRIIELAAVKELTDEDLRDIVRAMEEIVARRRSGP